MVQRNKKRDSKIVFDRETNSVGTMFCCPICPDIQPKPKKYLVTVYVLIFFGFGPFLTMHRNKAKIEKEIQLNDDDC